MTRIGISDTSGAVALTAAGVVLWVALIGTEAGSPGWLLLGLVSAAAVVCAWRAGATTPHHRPALASLVISELLLTTFAGFVIATA